MSNFDIEAFKKDKSQYYKVYKRKKANGKVRTITAPCQELKVEQKKLKDQLEPLAETLLHPSVHGFRPGRSIYTNAQPHTNKRTIVNIDITDFFPSIPGDWIRKFLDRVFADTFIGEYFFEVATVGGRLPQGSPCSPLIANCYLSDSGFDEFIAANSGPFTYTRYADDLTFSTNEELRRDWIKSVLIKQVYDKLEQISLKASERKTKIKYNDQRQLVTGVLVNGETPKVTREYTNTLRGILHRYRLSGEEIPDEIKGTLSYIRSVNIEQYRKLMKIYTGKDYG